VAEEQKPAKKSSKVKWIILLLVLLLLAGGGAGAYWWFFLRQPPAQAEQATTEADKNATKGAGKTDTAKSEGRLTTLPPFLVNLADPAGRRYLKLSMDVEVNAPAAVKEIEGQTAKVRDAIILLLSGKSYTELAAPEGKLLLKNEVADRLNQILGAPRVTRVYFTEFVIQ